MQGTACAHSGALRRPQMCQGSPIWATTKSAGTTWIPAGDAARVLRGECGDGAGAVDAERGDGLEVGLDAGAAAGVGNGDGERDGQGSCGQLLQGRQAVSYTH